MNQKFCQKMVNAFQNNENSLKSIICWFLIGGMCAIVILDLVTQGIL
jgi:hypothetical protein